MGATTARTHFFCTVNQGLGLPPKTAPFGSDRHPRFRIARCLDSTIRTDPRPYCNRHLALFILLAAMYCSAIVASIGFGMHEDDRDLLRYIWDRIGGNALTQTKHQR